MMNDFFFRSKRLYLVQSALWVMLPGLAQASFFDYFKKKEEAPITSSIEEGTSQPKNTYQINFNNIALAEYIRFIAKITNSNFIFDEADLAFTVTLVSEERQSIESIFSALAQILRINGLSLLEDGGNYIITKNPGAIQIPEIISGDGAERAATKSPLVTRIFRIHSTNLQSVATLIRSMISPKAQVAAFPETRQLIVSDIVTNVDKISSLLLIIDSPHSALEIESYLAKKVPPKDLISLTEKILAPFVEGTPLVFVPQTETNSIFIVSTPHLIERSRAILEDLDIEAKAEQLGSLSPPGDVFLYAVKNSSQEEILNSLRSIALELTKNPHPPLSLIAMLQGSLYIKEAETLVLLGDPLTHAKALEILTHIDLSKEENAKTFLFYPIRNVSMWHLEQSMKELATKLRAASAFDPKLLEILEKAKFLRSNNAFLFAGTSDELKKIEATLSLIDVVPDHVGGQFLVYPLQANNLTQIENSLKTLVLELKNSASPDTFLIETIETLKYVADSHSLVFTGNRTTLARVKEILSSLDLAATDKKMDSQFLYPVQQPQVSLLQKSLNDVTRKLETSTLPDTSFIKALQSAHYVSENHCMLFTGDEASLVKVEKLLSDLKGVAPDSSTYVHLIQNLPAVALQTALKQFSQDLKRASQPDTPLIEAIESMRFIEASHSLVFTGPKETLDRLKDLMPTFDNAKAHLPPFDAFFIYKPKFRRGDSLTAALEEMTENLQASGLADEALVHTLQTAKWVPSTGSLVLSGDASSIERAKELLATIDVIHSDENSFFLYKLNYASIEGTITYLKTIAAGFDRNLPSYKALSYVITTLKPVSENKALLLSGESHAVEQIKTLIEQYDTPSAATGKGGVFIYKPKYATPDELKRGLFDLATDLSKTNAIDPDLLVTIRSAKFIETNQSIAFTGSQISITQLKELLSDLDTPDAGKQIHHVGATTFFIYKLQYASASKLMASLKSLTTDLSKGGIDDKSLAQAIASMKWIQETNSILFLGSDATLQKIQSLISKFDIPAMAPPIPLVSPDLPPNTYAIYRPQYRPGDELIELICEFEQNLRLSGLNDPVLANTINALRWMPATCSLIITGTAPSVEKIQELLKQFDVPSEQQVAFKQETDFGETSFLIYKLQYHQGEDIRIALTKISDDLLESHKGQKIPMISALNAIQWIPVTNSLVTSGPPDVLAKIRELILNLDVPLRQVFIEVLILETDLTNDQEFGLSWSGRAQYKNQMASQVANLSPNGLLAPVIKPIDGTQSMPNVVSFPQPAGFDLGIIGDIILHKGKTFFTLGSLVNAIQKDGDTAVITNPKFIAQDSNNATIFFGQNIPFTGSVVQVVGGSANSTNTSLEYRNVGNNISITPTLGQGDLIILDITANLSNLAANPPQAASTGITTNQTSLQTKIQVPDDFFVCLTGQLLDAKTHQRTQIPCLGGLPVIGLAFSNTQRLNSKINLVIFVKPKIIKNFELYKTISEHQEDLLKEASGIPVLRESIDEGISWVKTPENE